MRSQASQILDGTRLQEYFREELQRAMLSQNLQVSETAEFYLVNLLTNFERTECLFARHEDRFEEEPLAIMFARALSSDKASQVRELKRLGDVSLYITGFFTEHLQRGPVSRDYYIDMGSGAYATLAGQFAYERVFAGLYTELSERFSGLAKVLGEISVADRVGSNVELLYLYDRWLKTGDDRIREKLVKEGLIPIDKKISC